MIFIILFLAILLAILYKTLYLDAKPPSTTFRKINDNYESLEQVQNALREYGVESCNLIVGIDYTKSNDWSGSKTWSRSLSLHHLDPNMFNPYQQVISIIGKTLSHLDEDNFIDVFGFGDILTKGHSCFRFYDNKVCKGLDEVLQRYTEITPQIQMSGPTNFAPLIREAIKIVKLKKDFHILLIITDGDVNAVNETADAIVEASNYPLSIVCIGVGDGPFDLMEKFDDELPQRKLDNFQFVNFSKVMSKTSDPTKQEVLFAINALMEVPDQYNEFKKLRLL
eukprot:TRINITY_DN2554_c0_g2_i1.p1 TRINITY_DN2554_c0_g2~~TRINITY_DN2554_c0_g2_i1.p1  ORF type:complete len:281 (-),score=74.38 TRINITY_DN2554_c0_g2_i1:42-884(-)